MKRAFGAVAAALLHAVWFSAAAAAPPSDAYSVPFTEVEHLQAKSNGVDYALYIRTPPDYATSGKRYPVMILLDADYSFALAVNIHEHLAARGQAPEMILVAIAYPGVYPDADGYKRNRTRDYTPSLVEDCCYGPAFQKVSGGGAKFRDFISRELFPYLDAHYRTDPNERMFVGHSFGGLFGAYTLLTEPDLFSHYLLVSGAYWYDDDFVKRLAAGGWNKPSRDTRVYFGVGSMENQPELHAMVDDQEELAQLLAAYGGDHLRVESHVFDDETHASIFPAAFSTGLRRIHYQNF